jgi:hypothetical protein
MPGLVSLIPLIEFHRVEKGCRSAYPTFAVR